MTHGKALKASDIERIHADLVKYDEAKLAIAKKYSITLETLNKIDWVRRRAGKLTAGRIAVNRVGNVRAYRLRLRRLASGRDRRQIIVAHGRQRFDAA